VDGQQGNLISDDAKPDKHDFHGQMLTVRSRVRMRALRASKNVVSADLTFPMASPATRFVLKFDG
jgi:hypothetical protein